MIRFDTVDFTYKNGREPVLSACSFTVPRGARVRLAGPSGCGKTTVLRLIMGLDRPRRGKVLLPAGATISAVFQEDRLIPSCTVFENVALFSDAERAARILDALGLAEKKDAGISDLSGGMKRRTALARALAHPSDILLLDEAFTGLDRETKENAIRITLQEAAERTLISVTHDDNEAALLCTETISLAGSREKEARKENF